MSNGDGMIRVHLGHHVPEGLPSPDVYFTPGYGRAASVADSGEWVLLEAFDGAWQMPLILQTLVDGTKDAKSPYGYSGVYASPSLSLLQVREAWSATIVALRELGVISVLLRHSPLVHQASDLPGLRIVSARPTIVLESAHEDSAWSGMDGDCRTKIRKALKNGYTGELRPASIQDLEPGGGFRNLYEQTMQRLDAAPVYFFSDNYYAELLDGLGSNLLLAGVRDEQGVMASSALLMRYGHRLHGHLQGSNPTGARMGSNNLLLWIATQFAIDQGLGQFHLGGGVGQRDGLFKFKRSFGGRELEYAVAGLIVDDTLYQAHIENRAKECDITTDTLLASHYFPAYRGGILPVSLSTTSYLARRKRALGIAGRRGADGHG
jgi:serine/alanine adding enzyme